MYIHNKGKLYTQIENDPLFKGHEPVSATIPEQEVLLEWTGKKLPIELFDEVASFCIWSEEQNLDEVQVRLMYHTTTKDWRVAVLPQVSNGLHTKETATDEERANILGEFIKAGYIQLGSIHHHCNASAFQSGTDMSDEEVSPGIHITLGKLNNETIDFHCRVTRNGISIDKKLEDVLELPKTHVTGLESISYGCDLNDITSALLRVFILNKKRITSVKFPEEWKSRVKKSTWTPSFKPQSNTYGYAYEDEYEQEMLSDQYPTDEEYLEGYMLDEEEYHYDVDIAKRIEKEGGYYTIRYEHDDTDYDQPSTIRRYFHSLTDKTIKEVACV